MRHILERSTGMTAMLTVCGTKSAAGSRFVVIYVTEDQVFSEPILKDFEKETGAE